MDKKDGVSWLLFIIVLIWAFSLYSQNKELNQKYNDLLITNADIVDASNSLNQEVNNAKSQAWCSYQNMGQTLEDLKNY